MKLKLTKPTYRNYTGQLGRYRFENGVSVEDVPEPEMARIGANFAVVRVDDEGAEHGDPSPALQAIQAHRERTVLARQSLERQSDDEKVEENLTIVIGSAERRTILSRKALEGIASKSGIAGLRAVAENWSVKSKSIPALLNMILDAQERYCTRQRAAMIERGIPEAEVDVILTEKDELPEAESKTVNQRIQKKAEGPTDTAPAAAAAASGDLAAAISGETPGETTGE